MTDENNNSNEQNNDIKEDKKKQQVTPPKKPMPKKTEQFRCAACGHFHSTSQAHPIQVRQENVPIHRQDTRFIRTTEVNVCSKCISRYGRVG